MKKLDIAALVIRILAICCFIQAMYLLHLFSYMQIWSSRIYADNLWAVVASFFPSIASGIFGFLLFRFAVPLGRRIVADNSEETIVEYWSGQEVQAIAFSVVGVLVFVLALPTLFRTIVTLFFFHSQEMQSNDYFKKMIFYAWTGLTGGVIQMILGIWLFLGSRRISKWWHYLRKFGT